MDLLAFAGEQNNPDGLKHVIEQAGQSTVCIQIQGKGGFGHGHFLPVNVYKRL
jgi:hypothetical protein